MSLEEARGGGGGGGGGEPGSNAPVTLREGDARERET